MRTYADCVPIIVRSVSSIPISSLKIQTFEIDREIVPGDSEIEISREAICGHFIGLEF